MERHSVGTANVCVYYPYLKRARSALAHYVHANVARLVDGIFIVQLNCPRTSMLLSLKPDLQILGEGRVGPRSNSCPRRCKRGLGQLHVERPPEVGVRRFP